MSLEQPTFMRLPELEGKLGVTWEDLYNLPLAQPVTKGEVAMNNLLNAPVAAEIPQLVEPLAPAFIPDVEMETITLPQPPEVIPNNVAESETNIAPDVSVSFVPESTESFEYVNNPQQIEESSTTFDWEELGFTEDPTQNLQTSSLDFVDYNYDNEITPTQQFEQVDYIDTTPAVEFINNLTVSNPENIVALSPIINGISEWQSADYALQIMALPNVQKIISENLQLNYSLESTKKIINLIKLEIVVRENLITKWESFGTPEQVLNFDQVVNDCITGFITSYTDTQEVNLSEAFEVFYNDLITSIANAEDMPPVYTLEFNYSYQGSVTLVSELTVQNTILAYEL